jgi:hypothetical protein
MVESDVLHEISRILAEGNIENYIDPKVKAFNGKRPYIGIFQSSHKRFFIHFFEDDFIEAITPKYLSPEEIEKRYGIKGEVSMGDRHYYSAKNYLFEIQITRNAENKLINNKYTLQDKKDFFIDIANLR